MSEATSLLWRPVGPKELELIRQTGMRAFEIEVVREFHKAE